MAPVSSAVPVLSLPPQKNTDLPMATFAGWMRPTKPVGGGAMLVQPVLQALAAHLRPASQTLPQLPQCCGSVVISAHDPAQHSSSSLHGEEHIAPSGEPAEPPCATLVPAAPKPPVPVLSAPPVPLKPAQAAFPPSAPIPPLPKFPVPLTPPGSEVNA